MPPQFQLGQELFRHTVTLNRASLVSYAAASGDHNPIHYNDAAAQEAGLPGVLAHGMLTMGLAANELAHWAGEVARITQLSTRFARPVVVPGIGGAELEISGVVGEITADLIRVDLTVTYAGKGALARARAWVKTD